MVSAYRPIRSTVPSGNRIPFDFEGLVGPAFLGMVCTPYHLPKLLDNRARHYYLVNIMPRTEKKKTTAKGIRFQPEVLAALRPLARNRGFSRAVNELLREALAARAQRAAA